MRNPLLEKLCLHLGPCVTNPSGAPTSRHSVNEKELVGDRKTLLTFGMSSRHWVKLMPDKMLGGTGEFCRISNSLKHAPCSEAKVTTHFVTMNN